MKSTPRKVSPAFVELKTRSQFICQSWKQADEEALIYPARQAYTSLMFQVPMYWTACVGYILRNEKGQEYNQNRVILSNVRYRLKNISDTFTHYMETLEQGVNRNHIIGQFYILATGKEREAVFSEERVDKVLKFMGAYDGKAIWEKKNV